MHPHIGFADGTTTVSDAEHLENPVIMGQMAARHYVHEHGDETALISEEAALALSMPDTPLQTIDTALIHKVKDYLRAYHNRLAEIAAAMSEPTRTRSETDPGQLRALRTDNHRLREALADLLGAMAGAHTPIDHRTRRRADTAPG